MGSAGNSLIRGIDTDEIIGLLDGLHAQSWVVAHFCLGLKNRLEGQPAFVLAKALEDKAQQSIKHAEKIAARIADLGSNETADPSAFVMLSPLKSFSMPFSSSDTNGILRYMLEQERSIIMNLGHVLQIIRDKDDLTFHLIREIVEDEVRTESELEATLGVNRVPYQHAE